MNIYKRSHNPIYRGMTNNISSLIEVIIKQLDTRPKATIYHNVKTDNILPLLNGGTFTPIQEAVLTSSILSYAENLSILQRTKDKEIVFIDEKILNEAIKSISIFFHDKEGYELLEKMWLRKFLETARDLLRDEKTIPDDELILRLANTFRINDILVRKVINSIDWKQLLTNV